MGISNLLATGASEFCREPCCGQCCSQEQLWLVTFITWPPLVHSWVARKLLASIDPLHLGHRYILCFTVWDFTSSLFSRRLGGVKARDRGLRPALRRALWERTALPASYPAPARGKPQPRPRYPVGIQPKRELPWAVGLLSDTLSCFTAIPLKIPSWKRSSSRVAAASRHGGSPLPAARLRAGRCFLPRKALGFL